MNKGIKMVIELIGKGNQTVTAKKLGVPQGTLSKWLRNKPSVKGITMIMDQIDTKHKILLKYFFEEI